MGRCGRVAMKYFGYIKNKCKSKDNTSYLKISEED